MPVPQHEPSYLDSARVNAAADRVPCVPDAAQSVLVSFYKKKSIFLTGATGYVGKFLMEKLLRSVADIGTIYVLIRQKKGTAEEKRLQEIFDSSLFDRLRQARPSFRKHVVLLSGDCSLPGLGLRAEDRETIVNNVHIIFHAAAMVQMDAPLKDAAQANVLGTRSVLEIARDVRNLQAAVFVSTAFSFSFADQTLVEEKVYDVSVGGDVLLDLVNNLTDDQLETLTPILRGQSPNTYCLTKSIAEDIVRQKGSDLPSAIFRPSAVSSSLYEPEAGWIDNLYGCSGAVVFTMLGIQHVQQARAEYPANLVPADLCVNALLATAWETATSYAEHPNDIERCLPVYNFVSSPNNLMSWDKFSKSLNLHCRQMPPSKANWLPTILLEKNRAVYMLLVTFLEFLPALLIDLFYFSKHRVFRVLRTQKKVFNYSRSVSFFATQNWKFENDRVSRLWKRLSSTDQALFHFDMENIDWDSYMGVYIRGCLVNILKEKNTPLSEMQSRKKSLLRRHQALKTFTVLFMALAVAFILKIMLRRW